MTPATIVSATLKELWFHTGTACNLECPFCLEGSKPGDTRLDRMTLAEVAPYIDEAVQLGSERFVFTGGEPLIVKDIVKILGYALQRKPCLVLTNGTAPLIKRAHQLESLKQHPHRLAFRVSIDHPDEKMHDAERGWGNFKRAIEGLGLLHRAGFELSIARHAAPDEDVAAIAARYRDVLARNGLPLFPLAPLPELGRPSQNPTVTPPTPGELETSAYQPLCTYSRMIVKAQNRLKTFACALTDDDSRFDLGASLQESLAARIALVHARCGQCIRRGVEFG